MIYAHRGYSAKEPEMTRAAYLAAIAWAERTGVPLGLETDVHFSADGQLICLHDLTVDRTSTTSGPAYTRTVAELRTLDFGSWKRRRPSADQRTLVTLAELIELTAAARARGVDVSLAIETKHPNPRTTEVEEEVAALLDPYGWTAPGAPVRIISFFLPGLQRAAEVLPALPRTLLVERDLGEWRDGHLPEGIGAVGPDHLLLRQDPDFIARVLARGHEVHVWTVNRARDITWCLNRGVTGLTTDDPAVAATAVDRWQDRRRPGGQDRRQPGGQGRRQPGGGGVPR
jgi:glycerophosphoryl diester phosphodiesterase